MFYELHQPASSEYVRKEYGENFNFSPHIHHCYELIVILSGEMTVTVNGNDYILNTNDSLLIFPNQLHSLSSKKSKHMLYIFAPKMVGAFNSAKQTLLPNDNRLKLDKHTIELLDRLDENSSMYSLKGILYTVCGIFDENASYKKTAPDKNNLLLKIFSFIESNYNKNGSLKDLSATLGYDYAYLSRYFKKITGISYNDYLNSFRLNSACYLLQNSNLSVIECAEECGYKSLRTFNRNFKEHYGYSPSAYRKKLEFKLFTVVH